MPRSSRPMRTIVPASLLLLSLAACNTPPKNEGWSGSRVDPSADSLGEIGQADLRSKDLLAATDKMAMDIAARLDITNPASKPVIVVGEIENKTTSPEKNYQIFLARLRSGLNASGARSGLEFVRERSYVENQRDREFGGKNPENTSTAYQSRAQYMLTGEVFDMPGADANYFMMSFQLVQLVNQAATGPNVGSGAIVWENMYEVKYQPASNF